MLFYPQCPILSLSRQPNRSPFLILSVTNDSTHAYIVILQPRFGSNRFYTPCLLVLFVALLLSFPLGKAPTL